MPEAALKLHLWTLSEKLWKERREARAPSAVRVRRRGRALLVRDPVALDMVIPTEVTAALRFRTKKGEERSLPLVGGLLKKQTALRGTSTG